MDTRTRLERIVTDLIQEAVPEKQAEALKILIEKTSSKDLEMLAERLLKP